MDVLMKFVYLCKRNFEEDIYLLFSIEVSDCHITHLLYFFNEIVFLGVLYSIQVHTMYIDSIAC
jgi:hypothetical protein